ncbi:hypothetical protein SUGI_0767800 [Cryptomeria japonica]|nr:hypothetical protein SUGI_0767800 [Cryptomeria japonica]
MTMSSSHSQSSEFHESACIKEQQNEPETTTTMDNTHGESSSIEDGHEGVRDSHPTIVYNNKHEALAHLEEINCSICLDDYKDKETLRILMDCRHAYHVDCIDAWLKRSSSCPICRNSPQCL